MLGALVRREIEHELDLNITNQEKKADNGKLDDVMRVYSYGSPACVDSKLSDYAKSYVTNCVLHDDVIPRLTPTSIRALLKHLLYIRETWVKVHLTSDLMAITERAKTAWAPKLRNGFNLMSAKKPSMKMYKKLKAKGSSIKKKLTGTQKDIENTKIMMETQVGTAKIESESKDTQEENYNVGGSIHEGDYFFEAEESLIEQSDEEPITFG